MTQIERVLDSAQKRALSSSNKNKENAASSQKRASTEQSGKTKKKPKATARLERFCQLYAEHVGAERTHSTNQCRKWEADGKTKKTFCSKFRSRSGRNNQDGSNAQNAGDKQSFAAINSILAEFKTTIKHGFHARHGETRKRSHSHMSSCL